MLPKIRLLAAILLLLSCVMPLSDCSLVHHDTRTTYGYEYTYGFGPLWGTLTVIAYLWPLILLLLFRKRASLRVRLLLQTLELLLCVGTIYWLYNLASAGKLLYGAYVAFGAAIIFTVAGFLFAFGRSPPSGSSESLLKMKVPI